MNAKSRDSFLPSRVPSPVVLRGKSVVYGKSVNIDLVHQDLPHVDATIGYTPLTPLRKLSRDYTISLTLQLDYLNKSLRHSSSVAVTRPVVEAVSVGPRIGPLLRRIIQRLIQGSQPQMAIAILVVVTTVSIKTIVTIPTLL